MKFNRNEHSRFVQWLDRTAEKNPLLWLPCILLLVIAMGAEYLGGTVKVAFSRREKACADSVKANVQLVRKPFALRGVAMTLVMAFVFMFVPDFNSIIDFDVFADDSDDVTLGYSKNDSIDEIALLSDNIVDSGVCGNNLTWVLTDNGTLTISGNGEMYNYGNLSDISPWTDNDDKITTIIINGATSIGNYAFYFCRSVTTVNMSNTVISIGEHAFDFCVNLKSITIPDSVTRIENSAFSSCDSLTTITIPESVIYIGEGAFSYCDSLTTTNIPNNITEINSYVFYGCTSLKYIYLPNTITVIGENAFCGTGFSNFTSPNCLKKIGIGAFWGCSSLETFIFSDCLESIGQHAFDGCCLLSDIVLPDSLNSIGYMAFEDCRSITHINIPLNLSYVDPDGPFSTCNITSVTIPYGMTIIPENALTNCRELDNVVLPNSVTKIDDCAFEGCYALKNIKLNEGLESIGQRAFLNCNSLENLVLPDTMKSISWWAFYDCDSLKNIVIPKNVSSINEDAFSYYGLLNITIYGYMGSYAETYANENNIPFKDISEFPGSDIDSSELTVNYQKSGKADINNIKLYEDLQFSISLDCEESQLNGADILIRNYDDDLIANIIPKYDYFYDDTDISVTGNWRYYENFKTLEFDIPNSALFDYFKCNSTYYLDISNIKIDNKAIITSEQCKEKYSFTTGFGIKFGEQTFNFPNDDPSFCTTEKEYVISSDFYLNEIVLNNKYNLFEKNKIFLSTKKEWTGSCAGISAVMLLHNNGYINDISKYNYIGEYPIPSSKLGAEPYGSRDIINYMNIVNNNFIERHKKDNDIDTINYIIEKAENIKGIDDIFKLGYGYEENGKKFGHAVVVLGGNIQDKILYIYDSNKDSFEYPRIKQIELNNGKVYYGSYFDNNKMEIFSIDYVTPLNYATFLPEKIKNKTRITTEVHNTVNQVQFSIRNAVGNVTSFLYDCTYQGSLIPDDMYYHANGTNSSKMEIVLPPENYYEISSENGILDYDIVNEDMFFAVNSNNAEKSIVSADDGIKLINAAGNFELTVSADESMPYDMFDISGIANGDVDCRYVNNEVVVNLDNTSDTVITFYRDLETEDYTIPAEYDSFIIGEQNDEEAIFIDTDGDGTYETEILGNNVHIHTPAFDYLSDETGHWYACTKCNEKIDFAAHTENNGVVTVQPTSTTSGIKTYSCTVCGYIIRTETIPAIPPEHTHTFGTDWKSDKTSHWHECTCGEKLDIAAHTENSGVITTQPTATSTGTKTYSCTVCGYVTRTESIPVTSPIDPTPVDPTPIDPTPVDPTPVDPTPVDPAPVDPTPVNPTPPTPTYPNPIIPAPISPEPGTEVLPPVLTINKNIDISISSDLTDLAKGEARIRTKRRFFENSAEVRLTNTADSETAAQRAMARLDNDTLICYPFDISVYNADIGSKMQLVRNGYITFEIPVPKNMEANAVSIEVYHIPGGVPEHIENEITTDEYGNLKVIFTANEFSPYMFTAVSGEDIASGAGVTAASVPIDFAAPVSNGVTIPAIKLPQIMKFSNKKRRYRVLRKRRLDDLVFVF